MLFNFKNLALTVSFLISVAAANAQLTGIKTIGGANPDYGSFAEAINAINGFGIGAGGATFRFRNGTYEGGASAAPLTVTGSASSPLVFESESGDSSLVVISSNSAQDVLRIVGSSFVTFRKLTIDYTGSAGYNAIDFGSSFVTSSHDLSISNCIIDGTSAEANADANAVIYASKTVEANDLFNITISNNLIRNGSFGIYFHMSSEQPSGLMVRDNIILNGSLGGISLSNLTAPKILHNNISTDKDFSGYGIKINNCDGKSEFIGNYIYTTGQGTLGYGFNIGLSSSTAGNNALIINNSVQVINGSNPARGLYQTNGVNYFDIYNNIFYVSGGTGSGSKTFESFTSSSGSNLKNNIFVNAFNGANAAANNSISIANAGSIASMSNNCYFTVNTGTPFSGQYASNYTSFAAYINATGETNSVNINPQLQFIPGRGWKATNPDLTGAALFIETTNPDIDYNTRQNPSTIGPHENNIPDCVVPVVTAQPQNKTVCQGGSTSISAGASGTAPLAYQWQLSIDNGASWVNITSPGTGPLYSGFNTSVLGIGSVLTAHDGLRFRCIITNSCPGEVTSGEAELSVTLPQSGTLTQSICAGESFEGHTTGGIFIEHFATAGGCDSIRILNLTVMPEIEQSVPVSICAGESYQGHTQSGSYSSTFTSASGCDSVSVLVLTVLPEIQETFTLSICAGDSYEGHSESGIFTEVFTSVNGCDSTRTLDLTVMPAIRDSFDLSICRGGNFQGYTETGVYTATLVSVDGCDSTLVVNLTVLEPEADVLQNGNWLSVFNDEAFISFQWLDCNNDYEEINGETSSLFIAPANGSFAVLTDNGQCRDTSGCFLVTTTRIGSTGENGFNVYPNPSTGKFFINYPLKNGETIPVTVYDARGMLVYNDLLTAELSTVQKAGLAKGIYFVNVGAYWKKLIISN